MTARRKPFVGLEPFTEAHRDFFFGRKRDARLTAVNLLAGPLLVIYGRSGVGKTSLLRAGVPAELEKIEPVCAIYFKDWVKDVCGGLRAEIAKVAGIADDPRASLDDFAKAASRHIDNPLVLLFDQFEEYFQYRGDNGSDDFERALANIVNDERHDVHIGISMRADALSRLDLLKLRIPQILASTLEVGDLDDEAAAEAIRRPLAAFNRENSTNYTAADAFVAAVIEETRNSRRLFGAGERAEQSFGVGAKGINTPFLQLALDKLWAEMLSAGGTELSVDLLETLGHVEGIANRHLTDQLNESGADDWVLAVVFDRLVTFDGMKIAVSLNDLALRVEGRREKGVRLRRSLPDVLDKLVKGRILSRPSTDFYEIQHDVLAQPIITWLSENQLKTRQQASAELELKRQRRSSHRALVAVFLIMLAGIWLVYAISIKEQTESRTLQALARFANDEALHGNAETAGLYGIKIAGFFSDALHNRQARATLKRAFYNALRKVGRSQVLNSPFRRSRGIDKRLLRPGSHLDQVWTVAFSDDGKLLASGSADRTAVIWDVDAATRSATARCATVALGDAVRSVAFHPREPLLMTGSMDGRVRFWSSATCVELPGLELKAAPLGRAHRKWARTAVFSADGKRIATGSSTDRFIRVWDRHGDAYRLFLTLERPDEGITAIKFRPGDSNVFAAATNRRVARLWTIADPDNVRSLLYDAHSERLWDVSFSPDGQEVATASDDDTVNIWPSADLLFGALRTNSRLSIFGRSAAAPETPVPVSEGRSSRLRGPLPAHPFDIWTVAYPPRLPVEDRFNPMDGKLVTGSWDNSIRIWDAQRFERIDELLGHAGPVRDIAVSPDGRLIASASQDGDVRLWPVQVKGLIAQMRIAKIAVAAARFNPLAANQFLAVQASDDLALLKVYELPDGVPIAEFAARGRNAAAPDGACPIRGAQFAHAITEIVILCQDGSSLLWDFKKDAILWSQPAPRYANIAAVHIGVDRRAPAIVSAFHYTQDPAPGDAEPKVGTIVRVSDFSGKVVRDTVLKRKYDRMSVDPAGGWIAFAKSEVERRGIVYLVPLAQPLSDAMLSGMELPYARNEVISLAFGNAGAAGETAGSRALAVGSRDGGIQIWDLPAPGPFTAQTLPTRILQGHLGSVEALAFSPDGETLATASSDDTVRLWDAATGDPQVVRGGHGNTVTSVSFANDGKMLLSGSIDGTVIMWDGPKELADLVAEVCRDLTASNNLKLSASDSQAFVSNYASPSTGEPAFLSALFDPLHAAGDWLGLRATRPSPAAVEEKVDCRETNWKVVMATAALSPAPPPPARSP